jgi:hypothetical protein
MGSKFTKLDLERVTDYIQFEFFCNDLMSRQDYKDIEPLGGHHDKGRDAIHHDKSTGKDTLFTYSVREDWNAKLDEDLKKIEKHEHPCDRVVFLTTSSLSATEKDNKKAEVKKKYGWELQIFDLERIATLVDNHYQDLRKLHPDIFFFTTRLPEYHYEEEELNRAKYATYLLVLHEEWLERYTPLLAEHREIETFVTPAGRRKAKSRGISIRKIPEAARLSVLLGESGAGKTTALWKIIVERSKTIVKGKPEKLPVLLTLREWAFDHTCRDLVRDQFDLVSAGRDAVERELAQGNCLILIDGLNELRFDEALRTEAYQDLQRFLSRYQENSFVLCCRASDYESRMLHPERLSYKVRDPKIYYIRRMDRDRIINYVKKYFKRDKSSAEELLNKLDIHDDLLWKEQTSIIHLARIPLYLQLFIAEFERSKELPTNQARLLKALIDRTLDREKAKQAARIDNFAKERLLGSFAYEGVLEGHWFRMPEPLARDIFGKEVQGLKAQSLIPQDLTVGAVWQEVVSNNFLTPNRLSFEWIHQLICDYFLGCQIVHIWTVGSDHEKDELRSKLSTFWTQPCSIGLGLLGDSTAAGFLEELVLVDWQLALRAFEAQVDEDQRSISEALVSEIIKEADQDAYRLKRLAVRLPSKAMVQTLIDKFDVCSNKTEASIAEALCAFMLEHTPSVVRYRLSGSLSQRSERLSSAVRRATDVLLAWTNNRNERVSFYAAQALWESEKDRSAQTFKKLLRSDDEEIVRLVRHLMDEWNIE